MTVKSVSAGKSGGFVYFEGLNANFASTVALHVTDSEALNNNGGVFCFANTGSSTVLLANPVFSMVKAQSNGGLASITSSSASFTANVFTVDNCEATSGQGGCLFLDNSGATTIAINSASGKGVTEYAKAYTNGGFIYA